MKTINDVRKAIKPLGFTVKTSTSSLGRHAKYAHIATKRELIGTVFSADSLAFWKPLLDWKSANRSDLRTVRELEDVFGLL